MRSLPVVLAIALVLSPIVVSAQHADTVRFAVLGDRTGDHVEGVYKRIVNEMISFEPEFVLTVGDQIEGYTTDTSVLVAEWDEYLGIVRSIPVPVYYTPGNHDITFDAMEPMYHRYVGDPYYSFDREGIHFIILDNSRWDRVTDFPQEQLAWVKKDLADHASARWTMVFMHKPYWYNTLADGLSDPLHDAFRSGGVDAVFTGHFHQYFAGVYDGIVYTGIGSSGGSAEGTIGGIPFHFGWVTVTDDTLLIAPVSEGSICAWDTVGVEDVKFYYTATTKGVVYTKVVDVPQVGSAFTGECAVRVYNLHPDRPINSTLAWEGTENWKIEPMTATVSVPPGDSVDLTFSAECTGTLYPRPLFTLSIPIQPFGTATLDRSLAIARHVVCPRAWTAPYIDGALIDQGWSDPVFALFSEDGDTPETDSAYFYFAYDSKYLYLGAMCVEPLVDSIRATVTEHDGPVYGEDCVGFFIQPIIGKAIVYQMYFNPNGAVFDQKITPNADGYYAGEMAWNGAYDVETRRGPGYWTVEAKVSTASIGMVPEKGRECRVNFRRKQARLGKTANWQVPIDYHPETFGIMVLE